jgi:glycosyltransferase involved in cell wall biosynthesis
MSKILYFITEDWFFASHFLPMARAARAAGAEVVVAARVGRHAGELAEAGLRVIPLDIERRSLGPLEGIRNVVQAFKIVRAERPDIVHCIALRPLVVGGIAARLAGAGALVLAPTGLGHMWNEHDLTARVIRWLVRTVIAFLRGPKTYLLFENLEDPRECRVHPQSPNLTIVGGAGVDPAAFPMVGEPPAPPVKVAVVSRMIEPKGIADAVEATRRARSLGAEVELHLFGDPDSSNRRSISEEALRQFSAEPGIAWHGRTEDVAGVWREHHIAMLLSRYREGLPRTLLEAAASGRPIITTDTPGCRELVRHGQEGILVAPQDIAATAAALVELAGDPALRARLGAAANKRIHQGFTEAAVERVVGDLYRRLLAARP